MKLEAKISHEQSRSTLQILSEFSNTGKDILFIHSMFQCVWITDALVKAHEMHC